MQKIFYINNELTNVNVSNYSYNKSIKAVNDLLSDGWHVVNIVCSDENKEGTLGGFVVIEKDD